jgi:uncharacterized protein (DUF1697 family)
MPRVVALLRGINLGANRRIKMADLREVFTDLGYEDVRTVLASGNVIYTGDTDQVDVILRTMDELHQVVTNCPFNPSDLKKAFVVFLREPPDTSALEGRDFAPDEWAVNGHELYTYCPDGMARSELMNELSRARKGPTATVRNLSTVTKLLE